MSCFFVNDVGLNVHRRRISSMMMMWSLMSSDVVVFFDDDEVGLNVHICCRFLFCFVCFCLFVPCLL